MRNITTGRDNRQTKRKITHEQTVAQGSTRESPLVLERASRTNAEAIRAKIAHEFCEAAKEASQRLVAEEMAFLERLRELEADAKTKSWEVLEGLESMVLETQAYREKIIANAQQQAVDSITLEAEAYCDKIIADAQQQARNHLEKSFAEAQQTLAEAELVRNEVREELETQKILTDAAKLRAESHEVLEEIRRQLKVPEDSRAA